MPIDPHLVPRKTNDAGTAIQLRDAKRKTNSVASQYGVVGTGATITDATIQTSFSDPALRLSGADEALFITNSGGAAVLQLDPVNGLSLTSGSSSYNAVEWHSGSLAGAEVASVIAGPYLSGDILQIGALGFSKVASMTCYVSSTQATVGFQTGSNTFTVADASTAPLVSFVQVNGGLGNYQISSPIVIGSLSIGASSNLSVTIPIAPDQPIGGSEADYHIDIRFTNGSWMDWCTWAVTGHTSGSITISIVNNNPSHTATGSLAAVVTTFV